MSMTKQSRYNLLELACVHLLHFLVSGSVVTFSKVSVLQVHLLEWTQLLGMQHFAEVCKAVVCGDKEE